MGLAESRGDADREAQENARSPSAAPSRRASGSPPGSSSTSMVRPSSRTSSSGRAAQAPSSSFLSSYSCASRSSASGRRAIRGGENRQDRLALAVGAQARSAKENAFAIPPQDLQALIHRRSAMRRGSGTGRWQCASGRHLERRGDGDVRSDYRRCGRLLAGSSIICGAAGIRETLPLGRVISPSTSLKTRGQPFLISAWTASTTFCIAALGLGSWPLR